MQVASRQVEEAWGGEEGVGCWSSAGGEDAEICRRLDICAMQVRMCVGEVITHFNKIKGLAHQQLFDLSWPLLSMETVESAEMFKAVLWFLEGQLLLRQIVELIQVPKAQRSRYCAK